MSTNVSNINYIRLNGSPLIGVRNPNFQRRETYSPIGTDGTLHQTSNAVIRGAPMISLETIAVRTLIGLLNDSDDTPMKAFDGANGIDMIGLLSSQAVPGYETDASHARRQMKRGQIYLSGLQWSPGEVLVASLDAFGVSQIDEGNVDPVTVASNVAFPTLSLNEEQLVLTALTVGAQEITQTKSWSLAITHQAENNDEAICFNTGLPFPVQMREAGVGGQLEFIATIEILDVNVVIPSSGTMVAEFQTLSPLGVGVSGDTTTVTLNSSLIREEAIEGTPAGRRITIHGTYDGVNLPLTIEND
jgi:hypothetical protein